LSETAVGTVLANALNVSGDVEIAEAPAFRTQRWGPPFGAIPKALTSPGGGAAHAPQSLPRPWMTAAWRMREYRVSLQTTPVFGTRV